MESYLLLVLHDPWQKWTHRSTQGCYRKKMGKRFEVSVGIHKWRCGKFRLRVDVVGQTGRLTHNHEHLQRLQPAYLQLPAPPHRWHLVARLLHRLPKLAKEIRLKFHKVDKLEVCRGELHVRKSVNKIVNDLIYIICAGFIVRKILFLLI